MSLNRRQFVIGAAAALACSGCATGPKNAPGFVNVGPVSNYAREGIVDSYAQSDGIMLVTFGGRLTAVSAVCTHQGCIVDKAKLGESFECPCHGSAYTRDGNVKEGPAKKPLVHYSMSVDGKGHVIVDTGKRLEQPEWGRMDGHLSVKG